MNQIIEEELPGIHDLRDQLLDILFDQDLAYKLPGHNPTLGELCVEIGRIQQLYTHSFKTFKLDWTHQHTKPDSLNTVDSLRSWFASLNAELHAALSPLSEEDIRNKQINRGDGFTPSPLVQFQIYHEALLIFYAKASVYLKAMQRPLPEQWASWIG
ncbi:MAG: DinB family protein [Ardenticatenaceae bacterium]|nr:DinB family protein [Ardenticatenaceae bacterium]